MNVWITEAFSAVGFNIQASAPLFALHSQVRELLQAMGMTLC